MKSYLYLSWRYLTFHPLRSLLLGLSLTLLFFLPLCLGYMVKLSEDFLLSRSADTPLVLGARGSEMDLVLGSLYFKRSAMESIPYGIYEELNQKSSIQAVPLHYAFSFRSEPIVGTSPAYFKERGLVLASGDWPLTLGECVAGARAASDFGLSVGDTVVSDPEAPFNLAGIYPLEMTVTGILEPAYSRDDRALFTDIKTSWIIEGLGHGHEDLALRGREVRANASLPLYNTISRDTLENFHFHGDWSEYPLSGILIFPDNPKSEALLLGEWKDRPYMLSEADKVVQRLMDTLFQIRDILNLVLSLTLTLALITIFLVLALTVRLRQRESRTIHNIGGSASMTLILTAVEMLILGIFALITALVLLGGCRLLKDLFLDYLIS